MTTLSYINRAQHILQKLVDAAYGVGDRPAVDVNELQEVLWILDDFAIVHKELDLQKISRFGRDGTELTIHQRIEWALEEFNKLAASTKQIVYCQSDMI